MCLEPKAKTLLRALQIQYPVKRSESPSQVFESSWAKCRSITKFEKKDLNPQVKDLNFDSKRSARTRIWIFKTRDLNLLREKSADFGENAKGFKFLKEWFESPRRFLKKKVEKMRRIRIFTMKIWIHHLRKWRIKLRIRIFARRIQIHLLEDNYWSMLRHKDLNPQVLDSNHQVKKCVKTANFTRFEAFSLSQWLFFFFNYHIW